MALKADFILSLCELIVGSKDGLQPVEKTVIDRCVHQIYQLYFDDPKPENMPILEDLYNALLKQDEKEARHVATALENYVKGSLNAVSYTHLDVYKRQWLLLLFWMRSNRRCDRPCCPLISNWQ